MYFLLSEERLKRTSIYLGADHAQTSAGRGRTCTYVGILGCEIEIIPATVASDVSLGTQDMSVFFCIVESFKDIFKLFLCVFFCGLLAPARENIFSVMMFVMVTVTSFVVMVVMTIAFLVVVVMVTVTFLVVVVMMMTVTFLVVVVMVMTVTFLVVVVMVMTIALLVMMVVMTVTFFVVVVMVVMLCADRRVDLFFERPEIV